MVDSQGRLPLDALLVRTAQEIPTLVAVGPQASAERTGALREAGCSVWASPPAEGGNGAVNLPALLDHAGSLGIDSILVEGGPALHGAFIDGGLANRVQAYIAPKLSGSKRARAGGRSGRGAARRRASPFLPTVTALGPDLLLECAVSLQSKARRHHVHRHCRGNRHRKDAAPGRPFGRSVH
ncbi:MAG: RibD family protein [Adlercreutzia equolifaciens]